MSYDCFDDGLKGPILVDAEVGRAILGLSVGIYPKEVLSVFPPKGVHLGWTLNEVSNPARGRAFGVKSITIHPRGSTLQSLANVVRVRPEAIFRPFELFEGYPHFCKLISLTGVLTGIFEEKREYAECRSFTRRLVHCWGLLG